MIKFVSSQSSHVRPRLTNSSRSTCKVATRRFCSRSCDEYQQSLFQELFCLRQRRFCWGCRVLVLSWSPEVVFLKKTSCRSNGHHHDLFSPQFGCQRCCHLGWTYWKIENAVQTHNKRHGPWLLLLSRLLSSEILGQDCQHIFDINDWLVLFP